MIDRCTSVLDDEEIDECEKVAADIAGFLLNEPRATDDLVRTLVWVILQNAGSEKGQQSDQASDHTGDELDADSGSPQ